MASIQLTEKDTFTKYYSKLCTIKDIRSLLPHFVTEEIIVEEDREDISAMRTSSEKVQRLLTHITGPLDAGNTQPFYVMLRIMEVYGTQATKRLSGQIKRHLLSAGKPYIYSRYQLSMPVQSRCSLKSTVDKL